MHDIKIVVTSKRSWTVAFDDSLSFRISSVPHAAARKFRPRSPCKPVARRISFDYDFDPPSTGVVGSSVSMPSCMLDQVLDFQSLEARPPGKQRKKKPTLVSEVRRSARLSAISNGFKPASVQSPVNQDPKKRKN